MKRIERFHFHCLICFIRTRTIIKVIVAGCSPNDGHPGDLDRVPPSLFHIRSMRSVFVTLIDKFISARHYLWHIYTLHSKTEDDNGWPIIT